MLFRIWSERDSNICINTTTVIIIIIIVIYVPSLTPPAKSMTDSIAISGLTLTTKQQHTKIRCGQVNCRCSITNASVYLKIFL